LSYARRAKAYVQFQGLRVDLKRSGRLSVIITGKDQDLPWCFVLVLPDLEIEDTGIVVVLTGEESTIMVGGCKQGLTSYS